MFFVSITFISILGLRVPKNLAYLEHFSESHFCILKDIVCKGGAGGDSNIE